MINKFVAKNFAQAYPQERYMNIKVVKKNLLGALNKHAELKMKGLWAILKRQYLKKLYFKGKKATKSLKRDKKDKNFCGRLYNKECKKYFDTLEVNKITGNKAFSLMIVKKT